MIREPFMDFTQDGESVRVRIVLPGGQIQVRYVTKADWVNLSQYLASVSTEIPQAVLNHLEQYRNIKIT